MENSPNLEDENTTLFQIWIMPDSAGGSPRCRTSRISTRNMLRSGRGDRRDGIAISGEEEIRVQALDDAEPVMVDAL